MKIYLYLLLASILTLTNCNKKVSNSKTINPDQLQWTSIVTEDGTEPQQRHEATFINIKEKMYLLGGRRIQNISIYDAEKNIWSTGSKPPLELHHFQAVVFDNKIYVMGALTGGYPAETPVPNIYIYDPANDKWIVGDKIPEDRQRGSTGVVVYQNKIYMVAGIKNGHIGDHKKWFDVYNPKDGTWAKLEDAPRARDHFQAAVANNKLYVLAGRLSKARKETFKHTIAEVDVYDFKTGQWSTLDTVLPTLRAGNMAINYHDDILVVGGESAGQGVAHNEVEALRASTNSWINYPNLVRGRHGTGLCIYKDEVYVASGSGNKGGGPELKSIEKLGK